MVAVLKALLSTSRASSLSQRDRARRRPSASPTRQLGRR